MTIIILKCILSIICHPVKCGFLIPTQAADFLISSSTALKYLCNLIAWMPLAVRFKSKPSISAVMPIRFLAKERRNSLQRIIINKVLKTDYIFFFFGQDLPYHLIKSSRLVDCLLVQISCYVGAYLLIQIIVQIPAGRKG